MRMHVMKTHFYHRCQWWKGNMIQIVIPNHPVQVMVEVAIWMQFKSFPEASHFREHLYIPHERHTICLDFTMWSSHCSASSSHSCSAQAYIPYILGIYSLVPLTAHDSWLDHIRVGEIVKMKRLMMRMSRPARLLSISLTGFFSAPDVAAALASLPELRR